jgi:hypothetical protein
MKITRRELRRLISESTEEPTVAQKLARAFYEARDDKTHIINSFELAVTLRHAQENTLDTMYQPPAYAGMDEGIIVDFVASPDLAVELHKIMGRINIAPDSKYPGMYYVVYSVN